MSLFNKLFNVNFFFFFPFLNFLKIIYFKIDLFFFYDIFMLMSLFTMKKNSQQPLFFNFEKEDFYNFFVKTSRVLKKYDYENFDFFNISEFVLFKQKEIYLKKNKNIFFLSNNLFLEKKYIYQKNSLIKLDNNVFKYIKNVKNLGSFFFVQYRIYGLGFRVKKSSLYNTRSLRFDIGFGHGIYYFLPKQLKCLKRKRRFFVYSENLRVLNFVKTHINNFKILNPYKIRGLKDIKYEIKMKKGKKQSKK